MIMVYMKKIKTQIASDDINQDDDVNSDENKNNDDEKSKK